MTHCRVEKKNVSTLYRKALLLYCSRPITEGKKRAKGVGCGDVSVCPCGRGSAFPQNCSYNVATGGPQVNYKHNKKVSLDFIYLLIYTRIYTSMTVSGFTTVILHMYA